MRKVIAAAGSPLGIVLLAAALALPSGGCGKKDEPNYGDAMVKAMRKGKAEGARGDLETISLAVTGYLSQKGNLPSATDIDDLAQQLEPTYVRRMPRQDPWGQPYQWSVEGDSWTARCVGRDGVAGNEDDLVVQDGQVTQMPAGYQRFQK